MSERLACTPKWNKSLGHFQDISNEKENCGPGRVTTIIPSRHTLWDHLSQHPSSSCSRTTIMHLHLTVINHLLKEKWWHACRLERQSIRCVDIPVHLMETGTHSEGRCDISLWLVSIGLRDMTCMLMILKYSINEFCFFEAFACTSYRVVLSLNCIGNRSTLQKTTADCYWQVLNSENRW